jgi:hypothetical protein
MFTGLTGEIGSVFWVCAPIARKFDSLDSLRKRPAFSLLLEKIGPLRQ